MATTIGFQKKVKNKLKNKEENNNDESLVCGIKVNEFFCMYAWMLIKLSVCFLSGKLNRLLD